MSDQSEKIARIRDALSEAEPSTATNDSSISVIGNGNIVGNGNTVIHTREVIHRPVVVVKTGDGVITASQKARLKELINQWVLVRNAVKKSEFSHAAAWSALKKKARVNKYDEIKTEDFSAIESWILRQIATINSMPSAPKKAPGWRNSRLKAIHARSRQLDLDEKRKEYMNKNYGVDSLTDLCDSDLDKVYRWVMSKK